MAGLALALLGAWSPGAALVSAAPPRSAPGAVVSVLPKPAYAGLPLHGSAVFSDPDGDQEGDSTFRWLVDGAAVLTGTVPQTLLLPLDGSLASTDGLQPSQASGTSYSLGRYGQALHFSSASDSRLRYAAGGVVDPNEGSLELWVKLDADLAGQGVDAHPRLFSYVVDEANQLYVEINSGRIILTRRTGGDYVSAWTTAPDWKAGEWHHLAATWSASANLQSVYYDCLLEASARYPALPGLASTFNLGSGPTFGVLDGALDDVRLSRRALTESEIYLGCQRGAPAPNDEVNLPADQFTAGQTVALELTPCDSLGVCGLPVTDAVTIGVPPLGSLEPLPGLLPADAGTVTLSITTMQPADCRWSGQAGTPYADMTGDFQVGQGSRAHSTTVSGLRPLDDRWFYVRCADLAGRRSPDSLERSTHVRVLGPWAGSYPRLANLWGTYQPELGPGYYAAFDLFIPASWDHHPNQAAAIRALNPNAKVLSTGHLSYDWSESDPLTYAWAHAEPGAPGYNCVLRSSLGVVLMPSDAPHPMYNLTQPACRDVLINRDLDRFLSSRADQGDDLAYDGLYWDRVYDQIYWLLGPDIDADGDGRPDQVAALDAAYKAGVVDYLSRVRSRLPGAILVGNEAPPGYASWLNGRAYEWQSASLLNGTKSDLHWQDLFDSYLGWTGIGQAPYVDFMAGATDPVYVNKYKTAARTPAAMLDEARQAYRRMRFGLAGALMADGLYLFDYGQYGHGLPWWYDEFGAVPGSQAEPASRLPPPGYLGQPTGAAHLLVGSLPAPDLLVNGSFESTLTGWSLYVDKSTGANALLGRELGAGQGGSAAAHVVINRGAQQPAVELRQSSLSVVRGQSYTLSFWARSTVTRTLLINLKQDPDGPNYGFDSLQATVTPQWQRLRLSDVISVTATDAKLEFLMGDAPGEVWLDDVQLQRGALGVWVRQFDNGLAVLNATREPQTVRLPGPYCQLSGAQAPLFQARVDDQAAEAAGNWTASAASVDQFGPAALVASADMTSTVTYRPALADAGDYEVWAWVAPQAGQSQDVRVTIHSAQGAAQVSLDESTGVAGWRSLGIYPFALGREGAAVLAATGSGTVVADEFKWVSVMRYNAGSLISRLTLQPQDGIVLTNPCSAQAGDAGRSGGALGCTCPTSQLSIRRIGGPGKRGR